MSLRTRKKFSVHLVQSHLFTVRKWGPDENLSKWLCAYKDRAEHTPSPMTIRLMSFHASNLPSPRIALTLIRRLSSSCPREPKFRRHGIVNWNNHEANVRPEVKSSYMELPESYQSPFWTLVFLLVKGANSCLQYLSDLLWKSKDTGNV